MHYYAIIIILVENGLETAILSLIAIISGTIYRPAKFVIVTGQRVRRELAAGIVNKYPVQGSCKPPANQPAMLADLGPYSSPDVKPPVVEALGPGSEAMTVVGQDDLF